MGDTVGAEVDVELGARVGDDVGVVVGPGADVNVSVEGGARVGAGVGIELRACMATT